MLYNLFQLDEWKKVKANFQYRIRQVSFPEGKESQWRSLFKTCAAQRLFLPVS